MDERAEKLKNLLNNVKKQEEIFSGNLEDVRSKLISEGIDFTVEELAELAKGMVATSKEIEELDEGMLANVSGGSYNGDCYNVGKQIGRYFKAAVKWAIILFG